MCRLKTMPFWKMYVADNRIAKEIEMLIIQSQDFINR